MKRTIIRVMWQRRVGAWLVGFAGIEQARCRLQSEAVECAVLMARQARAVGGLVQVVLHGKSGRIRWERTYGRDPRRSKG